MNKVVVSADQHCGSRQGLTPPIYWNSYTPEGVKWLWDQYTETCAQIKKIDLLVLNGDLIDGKQRRSTSVGLLTSSLSEQVQMAIECVELLASKSKKIIRIEGTSYHESFDGPLSALDEHFGIKKPKDYRTAIVRDVQLDENALLNVKHQPEGEGALYRGTTMDRELMWAKITEACKNIPKATHIIRSHLHSDGHMRGFGKEMNFTPCWCLQAPYALQKRMYRWTPDIGLTVMERDHRGFKGWLTYPTTCPLPAFKGESYENL